MRRQAARDLDANARRSKTAPRAAVWAALALGAAAHFAAAVVEPPTARAAGNLVWANYRQTDLGGTDVAGSVAVDVDGSFVLAGNSWAKPLNQVVAADIGLARYRPDGSLDTAFGTGGTVVVRVAGYSVWPADVAILPDHRVLVAGSMNPQSDPLANELFVARFEANGNLDLTFGTAGWAHVRRPGEPMQAVGFVVQPDGAIVVAALGWGAGDIPRPVYLVLAYVRPDGTLDAAVGDGGVARIEVGRAGSVGGVAVAPSNGVYAVIDRSVAYMMPSEWGVLRVDAAGKVDPTFAGGALSTVPLGLTRDVYVGGMTIAPLPDGGALVGRTVEDLRGAPFPAFVTARFKADGALDATYGDLGSRLVRWPVPATGFVGLATAPDGRAVLVANKLDNRFRAVDGLAAALLTDDGALDDRFGDHGIAWSGFPDPAFTQANTAALLPNGRLVAVGGQGTNAGWTAWTDFQFAMLSLPPAPPTVTPAASTTPTPSATATSTATPAATATATDTSTPTPTPTPAPRPVWLPALLRLAAP